MKSQPFLRQLERQLKHGILPLWTLEELAEVGETYGYALMERLRERGGPGFRVTPSGLYPTLARLKRLGLVEAFHGTESRGPVRKYYRITPQGREALISALEIASRLRSSASGVSGSGLGRDLALRPPLTRSSLREGS